MISTVPVQHRCPTFSIGNCTVYTTVWYNLNSNVGLGFKMKIKIGSIFGHLCTIRATSYRNGNNPKMTFAGKTLENVI